MFEKYSDSARKAVVLAQESARSLNHSYIGTEHLLAALSDSSSRAAVVLRHFGMDTEFIHQAIIEETGKGSGDLPGHIPFTPNARKVLEIGAQEFYELQDEFIEDTHLLLGILGMESGVGLQIILSKVESVSVIREILLKDMAITRAAAAEQNRALAFGLELHILLEKLIEGGGQVDAVDFQRGQANAAQQIMEILFGEAAVETTEKND